MRIKCTSQRPGTEETVTYHQGRLLSPDERSVWIDQVATRVNVGTKVILEHQDVTMVYEAANDADENEEIIAGLQEIRLALETH